MQRRLDIMHKKVRNFVTDFFTVGMIFMFMAALIGEKLVPAKLAACGFIIIAWAGVVAAVHWKYPEDWKRNE